jgi:hypothetical protein
MNSSSLRGPAWGVFATILFAACSETPPPASTPLGAGVAATAGSGGARGGAGGTSVAGSGTPAASGESGGKSGTAGQIAPPPGNTGGTTAPSPTGSGGETGGGGGGDSMAPTTLACAPRMVTAGDAQLHFHHIHFNSPDPAKDVEFFMKFYGGKPIDFCKDAASGQATPAVQNDRGYFLFTRVAEPADPTLDSELDHVGFASTSPTMELQRLMAMDAPLWPVMDDGNNITGQCKDVMMGTACFSGTFFYTQLPSGARIEVSNSPGPSTSGFSHVHLKGPLPDFFSQVLGPALKMGRDSVHVDGVNITNTLLNMFEPMPPKETKGKPIDHLAYSTTDLKSHYDRIKAAGIEIADEIAMRPEYGFKSFFVKSPQGIWVEIVEDTPFQP